MSVWNLGITRQCDPRAAFVDVTKPLTHPQVSFHCCVPQLESFCEAWKILDPFGLICLMVVSKYFFHHKILNHHMVQSQVNGVVIFLKVNVHHLKMIDTGDQQVAW